MTSGSMTRYGGQPAHQPGRHPFCPTLLYSGALDPVADLVLDEPKMDTT